MINKESIRQPLVKASDKYIQWCEIRKDKIWRIMTCLIFSLPAIALWHFIFFDVMPKLWWVGAIIFMIYVIYRFITDEPPKQKREFDGLFEDLRYIDHRVKTMKKNEKVDNLPKKQEVKDPVTEKRMKSVENHNPKAGSYKSTSSKAFEQSARWAAYKAGLNLKKIDKEDI